jgi:hypothetical protein
MVKVPGPPPAPNLTGSAATETWHLEVEGAVTVWVDEVHAKDAPNVRITAAALVSAGISALGANEAGVAVVHGYKKHSRWGTEQLFSWPRSR